jgi:metallo-beta-lactamase class B
MIDPGYSDAFYLIIHSMHTLGLNPTDVKYIINTHWHWDHIEATEAMADLSGAKTLIGKEDAEKASEYFTPDILVKDGDTLTLGNTTISFLETPGHTKGTLSFFFNTEENGKTYRVGMFGGAGANALVPGELYYEGCREDYRKSIDRLRKERVDVFIGNHVWNNQTDERAEVLLTTGENRFIDGEIWQTFLDFSIYRLNSILEEEQKQN